MDTDRAAMLEPPRCSFSGRGPDRRIGDARLAGKKIVVTGAGGFIGSRLVWTLEARGAIVTALVGAPGQNMFELPPSVPKLVADIEDRDVLVSLARDADVFLHLAGPPSVAASFTSPLEYERVHVRGTLAALDACRTAGVPRFVYLSSAEVYGRPASNPVSEDHALRPRSPYAACKAAAEHFVEAYAHASGTCCLILRPFSVYGPGSPGRALVHTVLRQAASREAIVLGDLAPIRDFIFVDDVVDAVMAAAVVPCRDTTALNIGSGTGTAVGALAGLALQLAGRSVPIRSTLNGERPPNADIDHLVANNARARETLGWTPRVDLPDGLLRTLEWMGA